MAAVGGAGADAPPNMALIKSLSELTPPVVDRLYAIDTASPIDDPTFVFLVGAPGVGKSSGHQIAKSKGYLPDSGYATINLDTLLESMLPFRVGSAMGHLLKHKHSDLVKFSTISSYSSPYENLGMFKWYDDAHNAVAAVNGDLISQINAVRDEFKGMKGTVAGTNLIKINEDAIERAIKKSVLIVYETTLSFSKRSGKVEKVAKIMSMLPPQYKIVVLHLKGEPAEIATRIKMRQEYVMPYQNMPFYRYIPPSLVEKFVAETAEAVEHLKTDIPANMLIDEHAVTMVESMLPPEKALNYNAEAARIMRAYGPTEKKANAFNMSALAEALSVIGKSRGGSRKKRRRKAAAITRKQNRRK